MQLWISLGSENMLPPESPIWTSVSRIVRFSCPRHNEFATSADAQVPINEIIGMWPELVPEGGGP